ncbi:MAG: GGDEF domain-containing protein [Lachnospiraceae bacterium]
MSIRIAFFAGTIIQDYQSKTIRAIAQSVSGKFDLEIFTSVGAAGESFFHGDNNRKMLDIPQLKGYAGIIVEPDTFSATAVYEELVSKIKSEVDCPVICLRYQDDRFYNILVDDYGAMDCMVRHFIEVHQFRRICHMTGLLSLEDARLRLKSYQDTMAEFHLPVTEHMIFEGNYWTDRGDAAVEWFLSDGTDNMPEAIVCANDYMALSVVKALKKRGIQVPGDICVSGFDNIAEVLYSDPRIASMNVPAEQMGIAAVHVLERLLHGETVEQNTFLPVVPCFAGSCGCKGQSSVNHHAELLEQVNYLNDTIRQITYMNSEYESCLTTEELINCAFHYSLHFDYEEAYICLCVHDDTEGDDTVNTDLLEHYSDNMTLYSILSRTENNYRFCHQEFPRDQILPEEHRTDGKPIYVFPLHYKNNCYGYVVLKTRHPEKLSRFFILWLLGIVAGMNRVYLQHKNKAVLQFVEQSRRDALTELYNRREFENILRRRRYDASKNNPFFIMSLDMDGLKMINDTYGHLEGDNALKALADILKNVSGDNVSAARTGGDEFLLCITARDEDVPRRIQAEIQRMVDEYNETSGKPYLLSVSIGYSDCVTTDGISKCMEKADQNMYASKFAKKKNR